MGTVTSFPNGLSLASSSLTPAALNLILQPLGCEMLGIDPVADPLAFSKVRVEWLTQGQPGFAITDDICFISAIEENDNYNRVRDAQLADTGPGALSQTWTYTRVWKTTWTFYGPKSFDRARLVKSAIWLDWTHDMLAASNLYLITDVPATMRAPELFNGQWWERTDLGFDLNEAVTETLNTIPSVGSVNVQLGTQVLQINLPALS